MSELDTIIVHPPGSGHPSLADKSKSGEAGFDRTAFMGTWMVPWSTLPMWKDKRDVAITYRPHPGRDDVFDSDVEYYKASSTGGKPSTVKGVERLKEGTNGATFGWTGKGWLFFVTSHWEIISYGQVGGYDWAVSYFSKTLFTPQGIDIYLRSTPRSTPTGDKAAIIARVARELQNLDGPVGELAKSGFDVPVSSS